MKAWRSLEIPPRSFYVRLDHEYQQHHERYRRHVEAHGLTCQECGGAGQVVDDIVDFGDAGVGSIPYEILGACGWCEGTGKVTRHGRGLWLRDRRDTKRHRRPRSHTTHTRDNRGGGTW